MPIKQCVCCICGKTINKAQTYHIGEGKRACKIHDGVVDKKNELQEKEHDRIKSMLSKLKVQRDCDKYNSHAWSLGPRCWFCGKSGIDSREFAARMLVAYSMFEQSEGKFPNPFGEEDRRKLRLLYVSLCKGPHEFEVLSWYKVGDLLKHHKVCLSAYQIISMFSKDFCYSCNSCASRFGLSTGMPDIGLKEMLVVGGIISEVLKPVVDKVAAEKLEETSGIREG